MQAPSVEERPKTSLRWPKCNGGNDSPSFQAQLERKKSRHRMAGGVLRYSSSYDPHEDLSHRQARKRLQKRGVHFAHDVIKEFANDDVVIMPDLTTERAVPKRALVVGLARAASMSSHRGSPPPSDMNLDIESNGDDIIVLDATSHAKSASSPNLQDDVAQADSLDMLGDLIDEIVADEPEIFPNGSNRSMHSIADSAGGNDGRSLAVRERSTDSFDPGTIDTYAGLLCAPIVDFNSTKLVPYFKADEKTLRKREAKQLFRFLLAVAWLRQGQGCSLRAATSKQRNTLAATLDDDDIKSGIPGSVFLLTGSGYKNGAIGRRLCGVVKQRLSADMLQDHTDDADSEASDHDFEYFGDAALDIWPHSVICFGSKMVSSLPPSVETENLVRFPVDSAIISRSSSRLRLQSAASTKLRSDSAAKYSGRQLSRRRSTAPTYEAQKQGLLVVRLGDIRSIRVDRRVKAGQKPGAAPLVYNYSTIRVRFMARPLVLQWSQMKDAHMFANSVKLLLACLSGSTQTFTEVGGSTSNIRCRYTPHTVQEIVDVHFAASHNRSVVEQEQLSSSWRRNASSSVQGSVHAATQRSPRNRKAPSLVDVGKSPSLSSSASSSSSSSSSSPASSLGSGFRKFALEDSILTSSEEEESLLDTTSIAGDAQIVQTERAPALSTENDGGSVPAERIAEIHCAQDSSIKGAVPKPLNTNKLKQQRVPQPPHGVQLHSFAPTNSLHDLGRSLAGSFDGNSLEVFAASTLSEVRLPPSGPSPAVESQDTQSGGQMLEIAPAGAVYLSPQVLEPALLEPSGELSVTSSPNQSRTSSESGQIAHPAHAFTSQTLATSVGASVPPAGSSASPGDARTVDTDSFSILDVDSDGSAQLSSCSSHQQEGPLVSILNTGDGDIHLLAATPALQDIVVISKPFLVPIAKDSLYSKKAHSIVSTLGQDDSMASSDASADWPAHTSRALGEASQAASRTAQLHAAYNALKGSTVSVRERVQRAQAVRIALEQDKASKVQSSSARREYKLMQAAFRRSTNRSKLPTHTEEAKGPDTPSASHGPAPTPVLRPRAESPAFLGMDSAFGQPQPLPGRKRQFWRSNSGTMHAATPRAPDKPFKQRGKMQAAGPPKAVGVAQRSHLPRPAERLQPPTPSGSIRPPWLQADNLVESASLASRSMVHSESQSAATARNWWQLIAGKPSNLLTSMPY